MQVMLMNVIYVPRLKINLLSVGWMTSTGIDVVFNKNYSMLSVKDTPLARGSKVNNLFVFEAVTSIPFSEQVTYSSELTEVSIWHHRLGHASYTMIERMSKAGTVTGLPSNIIMGPTTQCVNCPYGKQVQTPFKAVEELPMNIGDIVTSDVCGPFEQSMGGYSYFITWVDLKTRFVNIEFLKN